MMLETTSASISIGENGPGDGGGNTKKTSGKVVKECRKDDDDGMSFTKLCQLISEGRAGEVAVQQIPDELNVS